MLSPKQSKDSLLEQGEQALIMDVLAVFTDGPCHDSATNDVGKISQGLAQEGKKFQTLANLSMLTAEEIRGPQCRYCGNKTLQWLKWVMNEFRLPHQLGG